MRVRIHETRRKRRVAQIDYLRVSWDWHITSRIENLIALHVGDDVLRVRIGLTDKEPRRVQRDSLIGSLRRDGETRKNYKHMRRDFQSARLKAIRQTGKKEWHRDGGI